MYYLTAPAGGDLGGGRCIDDPGSVLTLLTAVVCGPVVFRKGKGVVVVELGGQAGARDHIVEVITKLGDRAGAGAGAGDLGGDDCVVIAVEVVISGNLRRTLRRRSRLWSCSSSSGRRSAGSRSWSLQSSSSSCHITNRQKSQP